MNVRPFEQITMKRIIHFLQFGYDEFISIYLASLKKHINISLSTLPIEIKKNIYTIHKVVETYKTSKVKR